MWKKVLAILAVLAVGIGLAVWGANPRAIATTDDGNITEQAYYKQLKQTRAGQETMANMILKKVLQKEYGNKVSKQDVTEQYNQARKEMGKDFDNQLQQMGMTPETFRDSVELQLLERQAVLAAHKPSDADLKKQYKDYQPETKFSAILVGSKEDAEKVIDKLDDGDDFAKTAKEYSRDAKTKDKGGKLPPMDSTTMLYDDAFKKAAFGLKPGEYTKKPVKSQDGKSYFIIKMDSQDKKESFDKTKSTLEKAWLDNAMNDQQMVDATIGNELGKADVNIKDQDLKGALSRYTEAAAAQKGAEVKARTEGKK